MSKRDYYEILGVNRDANDEEIKRAYRKQALRYHPDRNAGDKHAEEKFKEATAAYEVLTDPQKRAAYDRYGHDAFDSRRSGPGNFAESFFGAGVEDIFEQFFGGAMRGDPSAAERGAHLRYDLELEFEEAANGCTREISLTKADTCETCSGSGAEPGAQKKVCSLCSGRGQVTTARGIFSIAQTCPRCGGAGRTVDKPCRKCQGTGRAERTTRKTLKMPAGVNDGAKLRSVGDGEAGVRGGPAGDLFVVLHVKPHPLFERDGDDLLYELPISFVQAALGVELEVPALNEKVTLRIPSGTQTGQMFRVKGKGIKNVQGHGVGDLRVQVKVEVPGHLNASQKAKLQEFAALCDERVNPISQSFFEKAKRLFK